MSQRFELIKTTAQPTGNFSALPLDILQMLIEYISVRNHWKDLMAFFLVNKRMHALFHSRERLSKIRVTLFYSYKNAILIQANLADCHRVLMANYLREQIKHPEIYKVMRAMKICKRTNTRWSKKIPEFVASEYQKVENLLSFYNNSSCITLVWLLLFIAVLVSQILKRGDDVYIALPFIIVLGLLTRDRQWRLPMFHCPAINQYETLQKAYDQANAKRSRYISDSRLDISKIYKKKNTLSFLFQANTRMNLSMNKKIHSLIFDRDCMELMLEPITFAGGETRQCPSHCKGDESELIAYFGGLPYYHNKALKEIVDQLIICYSGHRSPASKQEAFHKIKSLMNCTLSARHMLRPMLLSSGHHIDYRCLNLNDQTMQYAHPDKTLTALIKILPIIEADIKPTASICSRP